MSKYIVLAVLLTVVTCCRVRAAEVIFTDKKGVVLDVSSAFKLSSQGEVIMRCQPVKATVNKKGTAISFKVVK